MPEGAHALYEAHESLDFPVGTISSKTCFYPLANGKDAVARTDDTAHDRAGEGLDLRNVRMIETRLLVRREAGWVAIPYVWNEARSEEHTSELQSLMRISYAVFCLKKKNNYTKSSIIIDKQNASYKT